MSITYADLMAAYEALSRIRKEPLRCTKCQQVFYEIGGKQYANGDIDQWCPNCGASDDFIEPAE